MRDPAQIRDDFPALARTVGGQPAAFFDGPAGSQVPRAVIDAIGGYLANSNANTDGAFITSRETGGMLTFAREAVGALLGGTPRGVAFGQSMTSLTYALSRAMSRDWGRGDEIVVTDLDHQANVAPWIQAAGDAGAEIRRVAFDRQSCLLDLDGLDQALNSRTRLVAIGYASNALGTINDVAHVCARARAVGALSFVDAVHYAPHGVIDVEAIGCDFLACSAYKFFGPHVGILWGRPELLGSITPYRLPPASDQVPERWESGTLNHEGIAGVTAAVEWIAGLGSPAAPTLRERLVGGVGVIEAIERPLFERLVRGLEAIPSLRIHGPPAGAPRTPTLAFTLAGASPRDIAERLGREGIFVWDGDFYASTVIDRLGLRDSGGVVRVGLAPYNTAAEIDRLVHGVTAIARS